jgi:hypothetical protein
MEWLEGRDWIRQKQETGYHQQVFCNTGRRLSILAWNKLLNGPAAGMGRTTKHLLWFLSDDEWLSDTLVDMMTAYLVSHLSAKQRDTVIANTSFGDAICSAKDISYHNQLHDQLEKFEQRPCRRLYAPMYTKNHYVAFEINFIQGLSDGVSTSGLKFKCKAQRECRGFYGFYPARTRAPR